LFGEQYLKGEVSFTSSPELGTTFVIKLPRQSPTLKRGKPKKVKDPGGKMNTQTKKVLLVDDDESQSLLERLLLERLGYQVQVCDSGDEALSLFSAAPLEYAFVMTDYTMVPMDGLEMAQKIIAIEAQANVLLCTGRDDAELIRQAKQVGVRAVALKPVNREEMLDLLESAGLFTSDQA
jgi:DNA-binding NtrC family response regulator